MIEFFALGGRMQEQRIFAKCAWRLIPFMGLLYLLNYIDRTNAGFAALTMNSDLAFSPTVFGFGAGIFFVGYALFQVPANVILERIGAKRWFCCIMAAWGLLSASNAFVQSPNSFYLVRFFIGVAEAGFFPGMVLYLTYWFPGSYLARVTANFMVAIPLSFIIGGPLASAILGMDGVLGIHGWQWLFLLEGMPAFLFAFIVLAFLPDGPAHVSWLTADEKETIAARLVAEEPPGKPDLLIALRDTRVILLGIAYFVFQASSYGVTLWLPQIVQEMGFSNRSTGLIVSLGFVACVPALILGGQSSSRTDERIWHVALPWLVAAVSLIAASVTTSDTIELAALALALIGMYTAFGAFFSLPSSFLRGTAAAGGIALVGTLGNFGSFFGPTLIGVLRQGSGSYGTGLAAIALGLALSAVIVLGVGYAMHSRIYVREPIS